MTTQIISSRHPNFIARSGDWEKWRLTYFGGEEFRESYLEKYSEREAEPDFNTRKGMTPIPTYAKAAINDIRNSIFQRMRDIVRVGGSEVYMRAVNGQNGGVDLRGRNMNAFLGMQVLEELLVMGRVGVFVDHPVVTGTDTLADTLGQRPYLYTYAVEDILSWTAARPDQPSEFQALLLRDTQLEYDNITRLPAQTVTRFRLLTLNEETGRVNVQFFSSEGVPESDPIELALTRIPFVMVDIGDSLIKDVCHHQIALLNLGSSDVSYCLKANFPFYVEQRDLRAVGGHLKPAANADGTATEGGQPATDNDIKVGQTQGRAYDIKAAQPAFIHPSGEPLEVSMKLQEKLEHDIRKLVNLAVINLASRASAESKAIDNEGLNAGISFIGLVLEAAERRVAEFWAAYEEALPSRREIATIKYPERYSLESDTTRIEKAEKLADLMAKIPGRTVKREIGKVITTTLLSGRSKVEDMEAIHREIDRAAYTTSDANTIIQAKEAGLVGERTASVALGFDDDEYLQAREDHTERIKRIAAAQGQTMDRPAARGVDDMDEDPSSGSEERDESRDTTMNDATQDPTRGPGRNNPSER